VFAYNRDKGQGTRDKEEKAVEQIELRILDIKIFSNFTTIFLV